MKIYYVGNKICNVNDYFDNFWGLVKFNNRLRLIRYYSFFLVAFYPKDILEKEDFILILLIGWEMEFFYLLFLFEF